MKKGFTLAEVLITIGVIGVVAALTLPTLIANTTSKRFAAQYKKSVSTLNQAVLMAEARHDVNLSAVSGTCKNGATDTMEDMTICGLFNSTLAGATFIPQGAITSERAAYAGIKALGGADDLLGYTLADGSSFYFTQKKGNCTVDSPCYGIIDVNGKSVPNKEVSVAEKKSSSNKRTEFYVPTDSEHMTDVFPIFMYGHDVMPGNLAAEIVLTDSPILADSEEAAIATFILATEAKEEDAAVKKLGEDAYKVDTRLTDDVKRLNTDKMEATPAVESAKKIIEYHKDAR